MNTKSQRAGGCRVVALVWGRAACVASISALGIVAMADDLGSNARQPPALPPVKSVKAIYYPEGAKRVGLEGAALVEFAIDAKGTLAKLSMLRADNAVFAGPAKELWAGTRFDVPNDWKTSAGHSWRY